MKKAVRLLRAALLGFALACWIVAFCTWLCVAYELEPDHNYVHPR